MTTPRKIDFHPLFKEDHFSQYKPAKTSDKHSDYVTNASVLSPKVSQVSMQVRIMKASHRKSRSVAFKYRSSIPKLTQTTQASLPPQTAQTNPLLKTQNVFSHRKSSSCSLFMPHRPPLDLDKAKKTGVKIRKNIESYRANSSYGFPKGRLLIDHFKSANYLLEQPQPELDALAH